MPISYPPLRNRRGCSRLSGRDSRFTPETRPCSRCMRKTETGNSPAFFFSLPKRKHQPDEGFQSRSDTRQDHLTETLMMVQELRRNHQPTLLNH